MDVSLLQYAGNPTAEILLQRAKRYCRKFVGLQKQSFLYQILYYPILFGIFHLVVGYVASTGVVQ
jgi:hypothetical protein